jgi:serine/threonine protein kinase
MGKKQSLAIGTTIGAYKIIRHIGAGGMGEVYEAYERRLDRRIALKIISPEQAEEHGQDEMVRRFIQEARTLAKVIHPNVVTIHTVDSAGNIQYIGMEYVDGVSLKELLQHFALTVDEAAALFIQLLEGLRALHENRILHRDMKPHNLMVRANGQVKILDFGIAKREDDPADHTSVGVIVGSVPYMPPEIRSGQPASVRSDLWSVGAILYECLVGRPLIRVMPALGKAATRERQGEVTFTQEMAMQIPLEMREIIHKLCAHKPENRYVSATEVIEELRRFQSGRPPQTVEPMSTLAGKVEQIIARQPKPETGVESSRQATVVLSRELQRGRSVSTGGTRIHSVRRTTERKVERRHPSKVVLGAGLGAALFLGMWFGLRGGLPSTPRTPAHVVSGVAEPLILSVPRDGQTLWLKHNQIVTFSWSPAIEANHFDLQIASDEDFRNLVISEPVDGKSFRPDRVLTEGSYYWRLQPHQKAAQTLGHSRFTLSYTIAPEVLKPDAGQVIELPRDLNDLIVPLTWKCKAGALKYRVQVSADVAFQTGLSERMTGGCSVQDMSLRAGRYYWRVRTEEPSVSLRVWSEPRSFTVRATKSKDDDFELFEPHISNHKMSMILRFKRGSRELINPPRLEWQPLKGARSYVVQISGSPDFNHLLSEEKTASPRFHWKNAAPGSIYWRVYGVNGSGQKSNFSSRGQLDVQLPPPSLHSEYKVAPEAQTFQLKWAPVPFAEHYLVQWSASADMANTSQRLVSLAEFRLDLAAGKPYVRVAVASPTGDLASKFSAVAHVRLRGIQRRTVLPKQPQPVIAAPPREPTAMVVGVPAPITPPNGIKVDSRKRRISVVFTWTAVEDAVGYAIEVASDTEFKQVLQRKSIGNPRFVYKNAELKGRVYWRVRAESVTGSKSTWSPSSAFEVK